MKILVLGATGFVGHNCVEYFKEQGHEVYASTHIRPAYQLDGIEWRFANLCDPASAEAVVEGMDIIIQAAAATSGCKDTLNDPAMHIPANAVMNSYIFKAATKAKVKHVIFPSCSVMCDSLPHPQKESEWDGGKPLRKEYLGFASTKIYCENLCQFYANISDTKFTVMRNTNYFGPYDKYDPDHSHVFGATVRKVMAASDKVTIWGSGNEARDFMYIENFCTFAEAAIANQKEKYALYNVGSGIAVTINELVQAIINHSGKQLTIEHDLTAPTIPTSLCLDTSKAKEELGWEPKYGLYEGIQKTLEWYKNAYSTGL